MEIKKALIEGIIQDLITYLCDDKNISIHEPMSIVYTKLCDEDTGLYRESSSYIYELLKDVIQEGCLNQK